MFREIPLIYSSPPILAEFRDLFNQINTALDQGRIAYPGQTGRAPVFAAELAYANGNIGERLLKPQMLPMACLQ